MAKQELTVSVGDGKYTFILYEKDYRVHCLRYGEPWLIFAKGHKAILALMQDLEEKDGGRE